MRDSLMGENIQTLITTDHSVQEAWADGNVQHCA